MGYQVSNIDGKGNKTTNEFVSYPEDKQFPKNVTLEKLNNYRKIEEDLYFESDKDSSQVITVIAPASETKDNAGNTMENDAVHTLVIDSKPPTVEAEYTQKNLNENNEQRFRNKNMQTAM